MVLQRIKAIVSEKYTHYNMSRLLTNAITCKLYNIFTQSAKIHCMHITQVDAAIAHKIID